MLPLGTVSQGQMEVWVCSIKEAAIVEPGEEAALFSLLTIPE